MSPLMGSFTEMIDMKEGNVIWKRINSEVELYYFIKENYMKLVVNNIAITVFNKDEIAILRRFLLGLNEGREDGKN